MRLVIARSAHRPTGRRRRQHRAQRLLPHRGRPTTRLLAFEAGPETLSRTNLGELSPGDRVNLETSLKVGDALGGHLVTGHIDAVGTIDARTDDAEWSTMWFRVPRDLTRQMASKGSVAVDGVSLTLVDVEDDRFSVALIPHTLARHHARPPPAGDRVNLETDILAKYVQRQLTAPASVKVRPDRLMMPRKPRPS